MAYTVTTTTGATLTLAKGDKISSIAGQARDLYIVEVGPYAQGKRRRGRIIAPVDASIASFDEIDSGTLSPTYETAATVKAQAKTEKASRWNSTETDANFGPNSPESREILYFNNADTTQAFGLIRAVAVDSSRGLMFPEMFTAQYLPAPTITGGDDIKMIPGTPTPGTPVALTLEYIDLSEQFAIADYARTKTGDALIRFQRDQLTQAQIEANGAYFAITPNGGSAILYQIWGSEGVQQEQTYHWTVYLKRVRS